MYLQAHVDVDGAQLYCELAGAGPAVVLLHGFTLDTRMWDGQFMPLARHFQVVRYDMRGFGRSTLPRGAPYSHVHDLRVMLDRLNIGQACLVGQSMGGGVALDFALAYPQRTQALVLVDTTLGGYQWSPESSARADQIWQAARAGGIPAAKESWLAHPLLAPAQRDPKVAAALAQIIDHYSGWHFANADPEQSPTPPAARRLAELAIPLLVMVGEQDTPDFVRIAESICGQVAHARQYVVPGVGHMANMEAPEQVTQAILAFLGSEQQLLSRRT